MLNRITAPKSRRTLHTLVLALLLPQLHISAHAVGDNEAPLRESNVTTIVLHAISGPECVKDKVVFSGAPGDANKWVDFFEKSEGLSIHYVIDRQGTVAQGVSENRVAWHALAYNAKSIGIELVNHGDGQEEFPAEQVAALAGLVKEIKARHKDIVSIVRHSDIDDRTFPCGGRTINRKQDPGPKFPFDEFSASVGLLEP